MGAFHLLGFALLLGAAPAAVPDPPPPVQEVREEPVVAARPGPLLRPTPRAVHRDEVRVAAQPPGERLTNFLYNVAVGVAVAVISALILRAIL